MAELTERQRQEYWRYNMKLTTVLLAIWFVVTYLISGLWAGWLNQFSFLGFPLGYYMAARIVVEVAAGAAPAGTICGGDRAGLFEATP